MRKYQFRNSREIEKMMDRARELGGRGNHKGAKDCFEKARILCRAEGIRHGYVSYSLAIACDNLGDPAEALKFIVEALEEDPVAPPLLDSYEIIVGNIRSNIASEIATDATSPRIAELYQLLLNEGAGDEETHLAMARHLVATEQLAEAEELLAAVTVLYPRSAACWELRSEVARRTDTPERAAEFEAELALLQPLAAAGFMGKVAAA